MPPDVPDAKPKHRSFQLTPERSITMRHRVARAAIIIYFVTFLAAGFVMCSCPGFFAVMALCAVVALIYGSRLQRIISAVLLPLAIAGFVSQIRQEQALRERIRHTQELYEQKQRQSK